MALRGVSFDILPGEIHGLVGENGAGKSTLMRIMTGFYQPDSGTIRVQGQATHFETPAHSRQLGISMVYQDTRLVDDLDVAQNISLGREPSRLGLVDRGKMESEAKDLLSRLGFDLGSHAPVRGLSLAERKSVEIARALSIESSVLILDEPTTGLDRLEVETDIDLVLGAFSQLLRADGIAIVNQGHFLSLIHI